MLLAPIGAFAFNKVQLSPANNVRPTNGAGQSCTPAVGSKGAYTTLYSSLDEDTYGLTLIFQNNATSAANRVYVVDIAIGGAGSEQIIIPDLIASAASTYAAGVGLCYHFPIFLPAGTRVAFRAQGSVTTVCFCWARAYQRPQNPSMLRLGGYCEKVGLTGIVGTALTVGTTPIGAWASLGTTTRDNWWWQVGAHLGAADVSWVEQTYHVDLAYGDGTNFRIISEAVQFNSSAAEQWRKPLYVHMAECFVPAGSTLYARAWGSATPDSPFEVCAYGMG